MEPETLFWQVSANDNQPRKSLGMKKQFGGLKMVITLTGVLTCMFGKPLRPKTDDL